MEKKIDSSIFKYFGLLEFFFYLFEQKSSHCNETRWPLWLRVIDFQALDLFEQKNSRCNETRWPLWLQVIGFQAHPQHPL